MEWPPPIWMATEMVSSTSCRVASCSQTARAWKAMQPSQRTAMAMASAISSRVLWSSAPPSPKAAWPSFPKAYMVSGMPLRSWPMLCMRSFARPG